MTLPSRSPGPQHGPGQRSPGEIRVAFVGAGPGHPDLITVRGLDRLRRADCVVHDGLVPDEILGAAPASAERIAVSRDGGGGDPGTATGRLLVGLACTGKRVVRLKGGDPSIFGRLEEETRPLDEAGIPYETVPGVTALLAAAASAGIPLTARSCASHVTILTGHEAESKPSPIDLGRLATLPGTLAVYMGMASMKRWAAGLVAAGRPADTAVTVVSRCSWPDERVDHATLGTLADRGDAWPTPAVVIVGDVTRRDADAPAPAAADEAPLAGRRILVTRPEGQGDEVAEAVERLGGRCVHVPVVRVADPPSWKPLDDAIGVADTFDWVVFASVNGVRAFAERLRAAGRDARALGTARLAAIGPATSRAMGVVGLACDLCPASSRSEGIVEALRPTMRGGRVLLVRADRGRDVMRRGLEEAGHSVTEVAAYAVVPVRELDRAALSAVDAGRIDWVTVTSGAIAESAVRLFGDRMKGWRVASISPLTTQVLAGLGIVAACEASTPTSAALVAAIAGRERSGAAG